jgi:hypothetical protein
MQSPWNISSPETKKFDAFVKTYADQYVWPCYKALAPKIALSHKQQLANSKTVLADSPFTTCTININSSYAPHKDLMDLQGMFASSLVLWFLGVFAIVNCYCSTAHTGGWTYLPEYRCAFAMQNASVLLLKAYLVFHGVSPVILQTSQDYRISTVCYTGKVGLNL